MSAPQGMQSYDYLSLEALQLEWHFAKFGGPWGKGDFKSGSLLWLTSLSPSVMPSSARSKELPRVANLLADSQGGGGW